MKLARGAAKAELVRLLAAYRRPGTPVFECHFRRLPGEVLKPGNCEWLVAPLKDDELPAKARYRAAGALGQIGCREAVPALIEVLGNAATRRGAATALGLM